MPLGAARITLLAFSPTVEVEAEVIRTKIGVSAIGNAQVDTAQSKFGGASLLLDGVSDSLYIESDKFQFDGTTGTFTFEGWFRKTSTTTSIIGHIGGTGRYQFFTRSTGTICVYNSSDSTFMESTTNYSTNTWHHYAFVKDGTTCKLFLDGVLEDTQTSSYSCVGTNLEIGARSETLEELSGHIDEVRISNTARYTTSFTPQTAPFVNDDNTLLLLHMDGTDGSTFFEDDNGVKPSANRTAVTVTANGNAQVDTAQSKFGGASAVFDSSTSADYLSFTGPLTDTAGGEFTFETWLYITNNTTAAYGGVYLGDVSNSTSRHKVYLAYSGAGAEANRIYVALGSGGSYSFLYQPYTFSTNTWYHLAITRDSSNDIRWFVNGTQVGSAQNNNKDFFDTSSDALHYLGRYTSTALPFRGYLDETRISNTARYTATFTAPAAPFANDDNTLLLLHMDGADGSTTFTDDNLVYRRKIGTSGNNILLSDIDSKFGPTSLLSGYTGNRSNGRRLLVQHEDSWDLDQDLTIECWVYVDEDFGSTATSIWHTREFTGGEGLGLICGASPNNFIINDAPSGTYISSSNWVVDTWYHLAFTRDQSTGTIELFMDGVSQGTASYSRSWTEGPLTIGNISYASVLSFPGLIDEFRVSSTIRYTTGFTPSTAPFVNDADTLALYHFDGTDTSTDFLDDNGYGTPLVSSSSIASVSYSGTTDNYLNQNVNTTGASSSLKTPGAITIVFLAKPTYNLERLNIMGISELNNRLRNNIFINTSGTIRWYNALSSGTSDRTSTETLTNNDWNLVAISKDVGSGQISGWMNGSSITFPSETNTGVNFVFEGSGIDIGIGTNRTGDHNTYMWNGDVAWVGVWPTYTDFTNSTNQNAVWDITNSRGIFPGTDGTDYGFGTPIIFHYGDESTVATNRGNLASYTLVEGGSPTNGDNYTATATVLPRSPVGVSAVGNAQVDTAQSKFGGASAVFDGADDYLQASGNYWNVAVGSPRTFECWVRSDDINDSIDTIMSSRTTGSGTNGWRWEISDDGGTDGELRLILWDSGGNADVVYSTNAISSTTWHHVAYVWDGVDNHSLYIDGTRGLSHTASDTASANTVLRIGNEFDTTNTRGWDGYIDEVRVSDIARYSGASFTAPTAPFTNDANTLLLLHMDGTDGSTTFVDDNGNYTP